MKANKTAEKNLSLKRKKKSTLNLYPAEMALKQNSKTKTFSEI